MNNGSLRRNVKNALSVLREEKGYIIVRESRGIAMSIDDLVTEVDRLEDDALPKGLTNERLGERAEEVAAYLDESAVNHVQDEEAAAVIRAPVCEVEKFQRAAARTAEEFREFARITSGLDHIQLVDLLEQAATTHEGNEPK